MSLARNNPGLYEAFRAEAQSIYNQNLDRTHSDVLARNNGQMVGLANRDFGELAYVPGTTATGEKRILTNQKLANERANRKIVKQLQHMNAHGKGHNVRRTVTPFR